MHEGTREVDVACGACHASWAAKRALTEETGPRLAEVLAVSLNEGRWRANWEMFAARNHAVFKTRQVRKHRQGSIRATAPTRKRKRTTSRQVDHNRTRHVHLAGRYYHSDVPIAEAEQFVLRLDSGNIHDTNAVKVLKHDGRLAGFVARDENRELAGWLRDGNSAVAFVTQAHAARPLLKVHMSCGGIQ